MLAVAASAPLAATDALLLLEAGAGAAGAAWAAAAACARPVVDDEGVNECAVEGRLTELGTADGMTVDYNESRSTHCLHLLAFSSTCI